MKSLMKKFLRQVARPAVNQLELALGRKLLNNEVVAQKLFVEQYRALAAEGKERLPAFNDVGFRKYSAIRGRRNSSVYFRARAAFEPEVRGNLRGQRPGMHDRKFDHQSRLVGLSF